MEHLILYPAVYGLVTSPAAYIIAYLSKDLITRINDITDDYKDTGVSDISSDIFPVLNDIRKITQHYKFRSTVDDYAAHKISYSNDINIQMMNGDYTSGFTPYNTINIYIMLRNTFETDEYMFLVVDNDYIALETTKIVIVRGDITTKMDTSNCTGDYDLLCITLHDENQEFRGRMCDEKNAENVIIEATHQYIDKINECNTEHPSAYIPPLFKNLKASKIATEYVKNKYGGLC